MTTAGALSLALSLSISLMSTHSEARVLFRPGKNRDGWFTADNLLAQVDNTITIFEGLTRGYAQGLFLFDNAPSHQKHADDAISARKMVKGVHLIISRVPCPHPLQHQRRVGHITPVDRACVAANSPQEIFSPFIDEQQGRT